MLEVYITVLIVVLVVGFLGAFISGGLLAFGNDTELEDDDKAIFRWSLLGMLLSPILAAAVIVGTPLLFLYGLFMAVKKSFF